MLFRSGRAIYGVDPISRDLYCRVLSRDALLALVARDFPELPPERVHHVSHHLAHAASAYLTMRRRVHEAALNDEESVRLAAGELEAEREAVKRLWKAVFGDAA